MGSASAAIRRHLMEDQRLSGTSRNVFTNKFRPSRNSLLKYFLVQKKAFTSEPVFHCCQRPFPVFDMAAFNRLTNVRIGPIDRRVRNPPRETLTYILTTLLDIRTSFCALIRRRPQYTDGLEDVWSGYNAGSVFC